MKKLLGAIALVVSTLQVQAASMDLSLLQEVRAVYGFDFYDHQARAGLISPVLTYGDLSVDVGAFKNTEVGGDLDIPAVGLNVQVGDILVRKFPKLASFLPDSGLLSKLTVGAFTGVEKLKINQLEVKESVIHYGLYTGLELKF